MFADPIIEYSTTNQTFLQSPEIFSATPDIVISVGFKPGVTDNPGKAALDGLEPFSQMQALILIYRHTSLMLSMG